MAFPPPPPSPPPPYTLQPETGRSISPSDPPTSAPQPPKPVPFPTSQSASTSTLSVAHYPASTPWLTGDPRTSSTQSLLPPSISSSDSRRKLLVIYVHGFLGNDQSFQSFPAHVHAYLSATLTDTHVIHSKIYPRYKTYRTIDVARDNFSQWLKPHEGPTTDVVLVGHSMGGILAADVVLMPNASPYGPSPFNHRILGHISLDCPFLGLHPGIIVSGITSLFKPAASPSKEQPQEYLGTPDVASPASSSLNLTVSQNSQVPSVGSSSPHAFSPPPTDPLFNQPFWNDAALKEQPFVQRMMHFANKYRSEGIVQAAARHVLSYLEFGGCLADPRGLEIRYIQLRALEDVDELQSLGPGKNPHGPQVRVRFVNYFTLCTGRPKTPKVGTPQLEPPEESVELGRQNLVPEFETDNNSNTELRSAGQRHLDPNEEGRSRVGSPSPKPSIEISDHDEMHRSKMSNSKPQAKGSTSLQEESRDSFTSDMDRLSMHLVDPEPMDDTIDGRIDGTVDDKVDDTTKDTPHEPQKSLSNESLDLPPIPDAPEPPTLPDLGQYTDKDSRKQAERESKRLQKAYDQAVKNRDRALRERDKLLEKRRKKAQKDAEKLEKAELKAGEKEGKRFEKEAKKEQERQEKERQKLEKDKERQEREEQRQKLAKEQEILTAAYEANKPRKLRQFCNLPDKVDGVRDRTWVEVFMPDVDEVGAHCGLFFPGPQYEQLVGDVGGRIVGWVQEDMTKRAILEMGVE